MEASAGIALPSAQGHITRGLGTAKYNIHPLFRLMIAIIIKCIVTNLESDYQGTQAAGSVGIGASAGGVRFGSRELLRENDALESISSTSLMKLSLMDCIYSIFPISSRNFICPMKISLRLSLRI